MSLDDKIKQQKEIAKQSRDPANITGSVEQIKQLGKTAIRTDTAFGNVSHTFEGFVKDYGRQFPKLKDFLSRWQGYHGTWKKILTESRDFATATSGGYQEYDRVYLNLVQTIENKQDIRNAVEALTFFSKKKGTDIPIDFANKFRKLGEDVKTFRNDFDAYLKEQGARLTKEIQDLQAKIKVAEDTAKKCDEMLRQASKLIEFIPIVGYFASLVTELVLPGVVKKRNNATEEAKVLKEKIDEANKAQEGLANMQTKFAALDSEFQIICEGLVIFAQTWEYFHDEAGKFADALSKIDEVEKIPESVKAAVDLARAIATPLQAGLDAYAQVIADP